MKVRVLSCVCEQRILTTDGLSQDLRASHHLAGHRPVKRRERPKLIHDGGVGPKPPRDTAILYELQRRHVQRAIAVNFMEHAAKDGGTRVNRRIHPQLLHPFQMRRVDLVEVNQGPPEILDRIFLIYFLDRLQKSIDACRECRMNMMW